MKKLIPIFLIMLLIGIFGRVTAQESVEFESVNVSLWPEYDNQQNLVIYQIQLSQRASLPAIIELQIPSTVTNVWTIAVGDSFDTVSDTGVTYKLNNGVISLTAQKRYIQIEYYDQIKKTGTDRVYDFVWPGRYPVNSFSFELRQPLRSTNVRIQPAMASTLMDSEGFIVSSSSNLELNSGSPTTIKIAYQRDTDEPSITFMQVEAAPTAVAQSDPQTQLLDYLPWIIGTLGVIFLAVAGVIFLNSSNSSGLSKGKRLPKQVELKQPSSDQPTHCPQCGKRAIAGDKFCRVCGEKLK